MRRSLRIGLSIVLAAVCVGSLGMLAFRELDDRKGAEDYKQAEELAELPELDTLPAPQLDPDPEASAENPTETAPRADPYAEALQNMDFAALREVNPDVLGWILIPGTKISYPVVQGTDNQYYLNHTWKKQTSAVGAIFLEARSSRSLEDFHTIVYGHRMNNGSMFAGLKQYKSKSYWQAHPCVYLTDDTGAHKYEIFAAYEAPLDGGTYQISFSGQDAKQAFLDTCLARSVFSTGVTPTVHDRILTLSTCTGKGHESRWVVQAVEKLPAPAETPEPEASATQEEPEAAPEAPEPSAEEDQRDSAELLLEEDAPA